MYEELNLILDLKRDLAEEISTLKERMRVYQSNPTSQANRKAFRADSLCFKLCGGSFHRRLLKSSLWSTKWMKSFWSTMWNKNSKKDIKYEGYLEEYVR